MLTSILPCKYHDPELLGAVIHRLDLDKIDGEKRSRAETGEPCQSIYLVMKTYRRITVAAT
jgi:hypothetical protein